jgi:hypothetical protein
MHEENFKKNKFDLTNPPIRSSLKFYPNKVNRLNETELNLNKMGIP